MSLQEIRDIWRIGGISMFDTIGSLIFAVLIARRNNLNMLGSITSVLIMGEIVHYLLGIDTPIINLFIM